MIKPNEEVMYLQINGGLQGDELKEYSKRYLRFFDITNVHSRVDKEKKDEWQKYLDELDQLSDKNSLLALKIMTALIYRRNVLYHNEKMFELLRQKQDSYFLNVMPILSLPKFSKRKKNIMKKRKH